MDLLNMTDRAKIREFYKKVKYRKLLSFKPILWLISGMSVMIKYKILVQYL